MKKLSECTVLIVDDTEENIDILVEVLGDDYEISVAMDGESALENMEIEIPDIILLDIMMPGMDGYEVCRRLKANKSTKDIPIVFLTAMTDIASKTKGFELGAVDYMTKPFEVLEVKARVFTHLSLNHAKHELLQQNEILEEKVRERTKELSLTQEVTIEAMACLAEYGDPETSGHINRTKKYIKILAERLKKNPKFKDVMDDETICLIYKSAPLHDIGKICLKNNALLENNKFTQEEFEEMKKHTLWGYDSLFKASRNLGKNSFLKCAMELARSHQEKWDGTGYPDGLSKEEIPLSGRLMAVADVYDALISNRSYKAALTHEKAVQIILEGTGQHFDPDIVDAFMETQDEFRKIAYEYAGFDKGQNAVRN
jgi:putative two-component system response regulator